MYNKLNNYILLCFLLFEACSNLPAGKDLNGCWEKRQHHYYDSAGSRKEILLPGNGVSIVRLNTDPESSDEIKYSLINDSTILLNDVLVNYHTINETTLEFIEEEPLDDIDTTGQMVNCKYPMNNIIRYHLPLYTIYHLKKTDCPLKNKDAIN